MHGCAVVLALDMDHAVSLWYVVIGTSVFGTIGQFWNAPFQQRLVRYIVCAVFGCRSRCTPYLRATYKRCLDLPSQRDQLITRIVLSTHWPRSSVGITQGKKGLAEPARR